MINDTTSFREALHAGKLAEAEAFLMKVHSNPKEYLNYDDRWLDHRQRELFQLLLADLDWQGAKRVIEATKSYESIVGRIARLEQLSLLKFETI